MPEERPPFEVVGEATVLIGKPQPAFHEPVTQGHPDAVPASGIEDMREQLDTANRALSDARREIEHLQAELRANIDERQAAHARAATVQQAHQNFREQVRTKAIEVAKDMDWCRPGLNQALRDLGLPEHEPRFRVPIVVKASQRIWVEIEADDEDDAIYEAEHMSSDDLELDKDCWEIDECTRPWTTDVEEVQLEWQ